MPQVTSKAGKRVVKPYKSELRQIDVAQRVCRDYEDLSPPDIAAQAKLASDELARFKLLLTSNGAATETGNTDAAEP